MRSTIDPMPVSPTDRGLIEASSLEDQLVEFFDAHYDRITRLAGPVCHAGNSAEDAVQAGMEQAWRRRSSLRDPQQLRWWLDRIVVREAIRLNRRPWWRRSEEPIEDHARLLADPSATVTPTRMALAAAFRTLPVAQRAAVVLHLHLGYSVAETADLTDASVETTRSRLRLARRRLRTELAEEPS